jgi:hypothetical protein
LGFRLNPVTYVDLMDRLLAAWNQFALAHDLWLYEGFGSEELSEAKRFDAINFYETLDFLYLSTSHSTK